MTWLGALEKQLDRGWFEALRSEFEAPYMANLAEMIRSERSAGQVIYPPSSDVFNALNYSPLEKTKVILVGQDPYHGPGQAHGLSFSVPQGASLPPSLRNIFKELKADLGIDFPSHGCLESWAHQGVLLLNSALTVRHKSPGSHAGQGWERLTDAICRAAARSSRHLVFLLWGKYAQNKLQSALTGEDMGRHLILTAAHPSPYSADNGFFGCRHFSKANSFLESHGLMPIDWKLK